MIIFFLSVVMIKLVVLFGLFMLCVLNRFLSQVLFILKNSFVCWLMFLGKLIVLVFIIVYR